MPEQEPSRFEAFKQGFSERLDSFKQGINRLKTIGEVAGLGVGISVGLVATAGAEEPVHNTNIPVLEADSFASTSTILNERTSTAATASDAQQDCVNEALEKPDISQNFTIMIYPGDKRKQIIETYARLKPTSDACLPLVTREVPQIIFKVQNPNNHKIWAKTKATKLTHNSGDHLPIGDEGGFGGTGFGANNNKDRIRNKKLLYRCSPGDGSVTHVQAVYKMKADSAVDGHTLDRKSYTVPVKVHPVAPSLVQGGGVAKAC